MTEWTDWDTRLTAIAREHADLAGPVGNRFRAHLASLQLQAGRSTLGMAHAQVRHHLMSAIRHAFKGAALLRKLPPAEVALALRLGSIQAPAAARYRWLAESFPALTCKSLPRLGLVAIPEALLVISILAAENPILAEFFEPMP